MRIIFYLISFIVLIILLITPEAFHDDTSKLFDRIIFIGCIINMVLASVKTIKIKQYNFYIVAVLQLIYCFITVSYYDHNDFYWLRIFSIISKSNTIFDNGILSLLETLMYYLINNYFLYKKFIFNYFSVFCEKQVENHFINLFLERE